MSVFDADAAGGDKSTALLRESWRQRSYVLHQQNARVRLNYESNVPLLSLSLLSVCVSAVGSNVCSDSKVQNI